MVGEGRKWKKSKGKSDRMKGKKNARKEETRNIKEVAGH